MIYISIKHARFLITEGLLTALFYFTLVYTNILSAKQIAANGAFILKKHYVVFHTTVAQYH